MADPIAANDEPWGECIGQARPDGALVRQATIPDLPAIMRIERESFLPGVVEGEEVFRGRIRVFPEGFLVLEVPGTSGPVGYVCSEIWDGTEKLSAGLFELGQAVEGRHRPGGRVLYVSSTGLLRKARGRGLGHLLFATLIERVRANRPDVASIVLIVSEAWTAARRIYAAEGFVEVLRIDGFFQPVGGRREAGIVMRRDGF
jgi:ribosomal-protein-alanine N-acetyltransferase